MKTLLAFIFFIGFTSNSNFKKKILPYSLVITKADLIVEGNISDVSFSLHQYDLNVTEFIKGESEQNITVDMWKEWTCDQRIEKPKKGQKLLLFLTKQRSGHYEIINGSTGELFIRKDDSVETFMNWELPKLDELKTGIKMFTQAFEYRDGNESYFEKRISEDAMDKMIAENNFFKSLAERVYKK